VAEFAYSHVDALGRGTSSEVSTTCSVQRAYLDVRLMRLGRLGAMVLLFYANLIDKTFTPK